MQTIHTTSAVELLVSAAADDGTSDRLADQVHRGQLLRLRRGVYAEADCWLTAPTWRRHEISTAAEALTGSALFCRETALRLHGLPVLNMPAAIQLRTTGRGRVKTEPEWPMTGQVSPTQFLARRSQAPGAMPADAAALRNITRKHMEPVLPAGITRPQLRAAVARGDYSNPEVVVAADALSGICGPSAGYRVEPAGLAVVDTVSRLPFADAVVILDAVKARADIDVEPWLPYLRTQRQRRRWERAWAFADPRAESALESESRAVLHQLGFPPPTLQKVVRTRIGTFRLDMCWEGERVAAEIDGRSKYFDQGLTGDRQAEEIHYAEKQRREAIEEEGWQMARWGKAQVRRPEQLIRRLKSCGVHPR